MQTLMKTTAATYGMRGACVLLQRASVEKSMPAMTTLEVLCVPSMPHRHRLVTCHSMLQKGRLQGHTRSLLRWTAGTGRSRAWRFMPVSRAMVLSMTSRSYEQLLCVTSASCLLGIPTHHEERLKSLC